MSLPPDHGFIIAAAIKDGAVICTLPRPSRHHDIIKAMVKSGRPTPIDGAQGFLTSEGNFLNRADAMTVARDAGQVKRGQETKRELFSEDVW